MEKIIEKYLGVFISILNFIIIALIIKYDTSNPRVDIHLYIEYSFLPSLFCLLYLTNQRGKNIITNLFIIINILFLILYVFFWWLSNNVTA